MPDFANDPNKSDVENQDDVQAAVSTTVEEQGFVGVDPYFAHEPSLKVLKPLDPEFESVEDQATVTLVTAPDPARPGVVVNAPADEKVETKESAPDDKAASGSVSGAEKVGAHSAPTAPASPK